MRVRGFAVLLLAGLLFGLCACGATPEALYGDWVCTEYLNEEDARTILARLDFTDAEIAAADPAGMGLVRQAAFRADGTYRLGYDREASAELLRGYFDALIAALYENRQSLTADYGPEIADLTPEEFRLGYARMFGCDSYDALPEHLASAALENIGLDEAAETGTYTAGLTGGKILCRADGSDTREALGFQADGNSLTLLFADRTEEYTRAAGQ